VTFIALKWTFVSTLFGQNILALVLALAFALALWSIYLGV